MYVFADKFDFYGLQEANRLFGPTILFLFTLIVSFVLVNVFVTVVLEAFIVVKYDLSLQSNEYEIVDFMLERFKIITGLGEPKKKPPKRKKREPYVNVEDYVEGILRHFCLQCPSEHFSSYEISDRIRIHCVKQYFVAM